MKIQAIIFFLTGILCLTQGALSGQESLKVFILAGQSNMEGYGTVYNSDVPGTLEYFLDNDASGDFTALREADGTFIEREDVWLRYNRDSDQSLLTGAWGVGYGAWDEAFIGPEYGFGYQLGEYFDEQVLIIKTAWGGKSLAVDFRPPSSGGTTGPYYNLIVQEVQEALSNIATEFPEYDGSEPEIAGFGWHQGWNDGEEDAYLAEYADNMINFIADIRADLNAPDMKFVIGNTGQGGTELWTNDLWVLNLQTILVPAQAEAADYAGHEGVGLADTRPFFRSFEDSPEDAVHHWNDNGETYLKIGNAMGEVMIELLEAETVSTTGVSQKQIEIFPSLTEGFIHFRGLKGDNTIRIFNSQAQLVWQQKSSASEVRTDVSDLLTGLYFVSVEAEDGTIRTGRFVKY